MPLQLSHLPPVPFPQIRLTLSLFQAKAIVHFLDEEYNIIHDSIPEHEAYSVQKVGGDLVRAIEDLEEKPFHRLLMPDWSIPDDLPETFQLFNPGDLVWDASDSRYIPPIDAIDSPKNFAIIIAAISFLLELEDEIDSTIKAPLTERVFSWLEMMISRGLIIDKFLIDSHKNLAKKTIDSLLSRPFENLEDESSNFDRLSDIVKALIPQEEF